MDQQEALKLARNFIQAIGDTVSLRAVYVFGSVVSDSMHQYSDIDVALFVEGVDQFSYLDLLVRLYRVADGIDPRIEPHVFTLDSPHNRFVDNIEKTGIRIA